VLLLLQVSTL